MTVLWGGGEIDALVPSESTVYEEDTEDIGGVYDIVYDSTWSRAAVFVPNGNTYAETQPAWSAASTFWFHGVVNYNTFPTGPAYLFYFYEGPTAVFRMAVTSTTWQMQYLSAPSVWSNIGSSFAVTGLTLQTVDVKLDRAAGTAECYVSGTLRAAGTVGAMSQFTGVTHVRLSAITGAYWSQILCKTTSTIGRVVSTKEATGNGANTAWTGDYTGIDEVPYSDADAITSGTATQVETFTGPTPTVNGYLVEAVIVNARAKRGETGPANLQLAIRTSATNYFSSSSALSLGYTGHCGVWETNPNTGAAWVAATAQAAEFGVKSIT